MYFPVKSTLIADGFAVLKQLWTTFAPEIRLTNVSISTFFILNSASVQ